MPELMLCDLQQTLPLEQDRIIVLAVVAPIKPAAVLPCQRCECQGRFIVSADPHKMLLGRSLSRDGSRQGRVRRGKIAARRLLDPSEERRAREDLLNRHDVRVWQYQGSSAARYGEVAFPSDADGPATETRGLTGCQDVVSRRPHGRTVTPGVTHAPVHSFGFLELHRKERSKTVVVDDNCGCVSPPQ